MDNEVFRSTLDRRFASFYNIEAGEKKKWGILLATFFCNYVLSGVILSYGVILSISLSSEVPIYELLAAPGIFYVSWSLSDPWFRDAVESWKYGISCRTLAFAGVFLCCLGVASCTIAESQIVHAVCFGLLGGIGTSLVLSQINYVITDVFQININKVRNLSYYGQAMGQCTMPFLVMVIFHFYGHRMGYLLVSCCVIQLLPFVLYLKTGHVQQPRAISQIGSYVRAYSVFSDDIPINGGQNDVQLVDLSKKSWKSPSDENLSKNTDEHEEDVDYDEVYENEKDVEDERMKTLYGVDILPQILEESEHESEGEANDTSDSSNKSDRVKASEQKKIKDDINRLSVISDKLDEIIIKSDVKYDLIEKEKKESPKYNLPKVTDGPTEQYKNAESKNEYSSVRTSKHSMDWLNDNSHLEYSKNFLPNFMCCCSSYRCYRSKRKIRNVFENVNDTFIRPLKLSLKTLQFYPALLLKVCSIFIPCCLSSLIALLGDDIEPKLHMAQLAFVLSIHGIAWLVFLIISPWLNAMPKSNYKYVAAFGCFVSAVGSFVIMDSNLFEFIALGSGITGIGYGAISTTCEDTIRDSIGVRKWSRVRGTLDSLTGLIVACLVVWLSFLLSQQGLTHCFGVLTATLSISGLTWVVIPLVVTIRKHHNVQHMWPGI